MLDLAAGFFWFLGFFVLLWYSFPFFPLPPALHNTSSWSLGFSISAKYEINGSHFKASWKQNTLLHQHNYVSDHGSEKADSMEPPSTKPMPGLFWTWKMHVRCWPRALHCTGRIVSVVRKLDWCSRTEFAVVNFFWSRWMLLLHKETSLSWWQVVAHFYFSLRCESHLNCLTDTKTWG